MEKGIRRFCWNCGYTATVEELRSTYKLSTGAVDDNFNCPNCERQIMNDHPASDWVVEVADRFLRRKATIGNLRAAVRAAKEE